MTDLTIAEAEAQRTAIVADIRAFADWLEANPWAPPPTILNTSEHLNGIGDPNPAATLARLRELVKRFGGEVDESLTDRTRGTLMVGRVEYKLLAWHTAGRPGDVDPRDAELARLRAEVAELKAKPADPTGMQWARSDAPEDGDLTQPGRVEPHTGGVTDGGLVDETGGRACTCPLGPEDAHFPDCPKYVPPTDPDDLPCQPASGLTRAADQSRGPLAGTTPVVTYFSFGHGQTDPGTGKRLLNHYVTVVAPTYEACREAMFASRFGRAWSFDYLAGTARATEWIPLWTEHEVIVAPGTDLALADRALGEALNVLSAQVCADEEPF